MSHGCVSPWGTIQPQSPSVTLGMVLGALISPQFISWEFGPPLLTTGEETKSRALQALTFSPCSWKEWPNPCYCFLLHLNFHLATFPFSPQFLKYFLTFLSGKSRDLTRPFLFSLGKGHFSTTHFCSVYTELSKEEKNVEFIPAEEGADLHFPALARAAFSLHC